MSKPEIEVAELTFTNVRWKIPVDAMKKIMKHQSLLVLTLKRDVTQEEAAIDLIRSRILPKTIILHD